MIAKRVLLTVVTLFLIMSILSAAWFLTDLKFMNRTVISVPRDCTTIQRAIELVASGGIVKVSPGVYEENLVIDKPISLIGESKTDTIVQWSGNRVITLAASRIKVSNFTIQGGQRGIYTESILQDCIIENNVITNNSRGIYLQSTIDIQNNIRLVNNIVDSNNIGMILEHCRNSSLINNIFINNDVGLYLDCSPNCTLQENKLIDNRINLNFNCFSNIDTFRYIDELNIVNGGKICFIFNQSNFHIDPNTFPDIGYLIIADSTNLTIGNIRLTNNDHGLILLRTHNATIENVTLTDNNSGITLIRSENCRILECTALRSSIYGIHLEHSDNNTVRACNLSRNAYTGILLANSQNCTLSDNLIVGTRGDQAIRLSSSDDTLIHNNTVTKADCGIYISSSKRNRVRQNTLEYSRYAAVILVEGSRLNEVCENLIAYNHIGIELNDLPINIIHGNNYISNKHDIYDRS